MDRALEHALKRAGQGILDETHLPISLRTYPSHLERPSEEEPIELDQVLERVERMLIERALAKHPRNNTAAAKSLGISRARMLRRMQQWGLGAERTSSPSSDEVIFEELDPSEE
jgi:transcriptional regulator with PAS, ATPase and Fis domain